MKKITALLFISLLTAISVRADLIWKETFNYSNGPVSITSTNGTGSTTVSNWFTHSGNLDCFVNSNKLEVSSSSPYGGVTSTRTGDAARLFATNSGSIYTNSHQVVYVSFIMRMTNQPSTAAAQYVAMFKSGILSSTAFSGRLYAFAGTVTNTFKLGVAVGNTLNQTYAANLALNTDYQVVMQWDPVTLFAVSMWVNPISSSDVSITSADTYSPTAGNIVNSFSFRQASGFGGFFTASNLVVATTFTEALTNVLDTNAVAPKIVYQPVGTTNFTGASISLFALANGQGLGGMTYRWQQNGTDYGVTANTLSIPSAATSDTGDYTFIATTPYGLSVTSSIAKVLISTAPVPPTVTTQPASNSVVYAHQNLSLSVVAVGPPTLSYQWYRNGSPLSDDAIFIGTGSDTLTITDIATGNNNTGTYRCDVTNPNGTTPSSNAVVSVTSPASVSIGFLRTLVDPATLAPSNSTTAYQVTGVITTYTNITTGNTSSYYLQDGTGGINIFATFGSNFRPQQGDSVTFVGVFQSFSSGLELAADTTTKPYTSYVINSSGNPLPAAKAIPFTLTNTVPLSVINSNYAASLVTLSGVYFGANAGTTITAPANGSLPVIVTNSAGVQFTLSFFGQDLDTQGQTLPAYATTVTGVLYGFSPNYSLGVTKFSDIVAGSPSVSPIPLSATYAGGNLTFSWGDASFSLQSSTNAAGPYNTIPGATSGFLTNTPSATAPAMFFRLYHP